MRKFLLICKNCKKEFYSNGNRTLFCNDCKNDIDYKNSHTCSKCGKFLNNLTRDQNGRGYECGCHEKFYKERRQSGNCINCGKFSEIRSITGLCSDCVSKNSLNNVKNNKLPGKCTICNVLNKTRDQNGRGYECGCAFHHHDKYFEQNQKPGNCCICNKFNKKRDRLGRGISNCNCSKEWYSYLFKHRNKSNIGIKLKWCDKCSKETLHNGNYCIICNPNSIGIRVFNFIIKNNTKYYYDNSIKDYILWNEYKLNFINKYKNIDFKLFINTINNDNNEFNKFKIYPTFRSQDSKDWSNARIAFEQSLIDENIGWFVYIKFYIDNYNNIKPLVCGKSGSLLVNNSGSDLSFSTDINDGPSRRFLTENCYQWCKTHIAILKCNSENNSLYFEKEISQKYNLFQS